MTAIGIVPFFSNVFVIDTCVDFLKKIIDVRKNTWYVFLKKRDYFKGKPVERQGRKARRD